MKLEITFESREDLKQQLRVFLNQDETYIDDLQAELSDLKDQIVGLEENEKRRKKADYIISHNLKQFEEVKTHLQKLIQGWALATKKAQKDYLQKIIDIANRKAENETI